MRNNSEGPERRREEQVALAGGHGTEALLQVFEHHCGALRQNPAKGRRRCRAGGYVLTLEPRC